MELSKELFEIITGREDLYTMTDAEWLTFLTGEK